MSQVPPHAPEIGELRAMLPHIAYEWVALATAHALVWETRSGHFRAAFDSFLIHARALDDFLIGSPSRRNQDDVYAADYVSAWTPPSMPAIETTRCKMNKLLAHITLARVRYQEERTGFDHRRHFGPMFKDLHGAFYCFTRELGRTEYGSDLYKWIETHGKDSGQPSHIWKIA